MLQVGKVDEAPLALDLLVPGGKGAHQLDQGAHHRRHGPQVGQMHLGRSGTERLPQLVDALLHPVAYRLDARLPRLVHLAADRFEAGEGRVLQGGGQRLPRTGAFDEAIEQGQVGLQRLGVGRRTARAW
ncbi:hypothetical protein, partial [Calditerricola satsumensis]|uniref:hypothetical protein n=1 Tax=Calditerricola satsumensis TaxID=373054 RepID=UPI00155DC287